MRRAAEIEALHPGDILDSRFAIQALLGAGVLGNVFRANDLATGDTVAVKILRNRFIEMPVVAAPSRAYPMAPLLRNEVRVLRAVQAPGVPMLLAEGELRSAPWFAMEYLPGGFASQRPTPMPPSEAVALVLPVLDALEDIHRAGYAHRDLTPGNIGYRADGSTVLIDFGLARRLDGTEPMTITRIMGSHFYSAPESYGTGIEHDASRSADVFSAGRVLAWALGLAPDAQPAHPTTTPAALAGIIARATAMNPQDRLQTAAGLAGELRAWVSASGRRD